MLTYTVEVQDDGDKHWYLYGKLHREDGPAVEYRDGDKHWYLYGKLHREDGPAVEYSDGYEYWYLDGKQLTEQQFDERMSPAKELTVAQLQDLLGYNIKIIEG